jgi:hypothetical protein
MGLWFSPGTPVSSTNKTDCHDIAEILLKVALNTINPNLFTKNNDLIITLTGVPGENHRPIASH